MSGLDVNVRNRSGKYLLLLLTGYSSDEAADYLDTNGCSFNSVTHPMESMIDTDNTVEENKQEVI